jgi:hypothetical protein
MCHWPLQGTALNAFGLAIFKSFQVWRIVHSCTSAANPIVEQPHDSVSVVICRFQTCAADRAQSLPCFLNHKNFEKMKYKPKSHFTVYLTWWRCLSGWVMLYWSSVCGCIWIHETADKITDIKSNGIHTYLHDRSRNSSTVVFWIHLLRRHNAGFGSANCFPAYK